MRYDVYITVAVTIENVFIRDSLNIYITRIIDAIYEEVFIMDGTPKNTMVGQVKQYSFAENDTLYMYHPLIYLGAFGIIYTKTDIDLSINRTIAYSWRIVINGNKYYFHGEIGEIRATVVQKRFFANPVTEDSQPNTLIGYFDVEPSESFEVLYPASFSVLNNSILLLGTTKLNYNDATEINERILLKINGTEFNVSIVFEVIDVNDKPPYFLREPYTFTTTQSAFTGVVVGVVEARDLDSESILQYSITPNDKLSIDKYGVITLRLV